MNEPQLTPPIPAISPKRLLLGSAQFGMDYGVTNRHGQTSPGDVARILAAAEAAGISMVDTAAAYGASETVLGECLAAFPAIGVVTKTPAFPGDAITIADAEALHASLERSLTCLQRPRLEGLLLHHGTDLLKPGADHLVQALHAAKSAGLTTRIGVSVYDGAEIDGVLHRFRPDIVQLPLNLFDQRLVRSGHIARLKAMGIEVQARSILLQGVLLLASAKPRRYFTSFARQFAAYSAALAQARLSPLQACLDFALRQSGTDLAVVGVTALEELNEILVALRAPHAPLDNAGALAVDDVDLIDPRRWRLD
jgi:aryl-alcohol dehydrogenase-like predicted oxidoreductase